MLKYYPPAKLNLFLDILAKRQDGYHDILSLMVKVNLCDRLIIEKESPGKIILEVEGDAPCGEENICFKAAKLMIDKFGIKNGIKIKLIKNIPVQSGLGGASSDCAGVIKLINQLFSLGLLEEHQMEIGLELGCDVPFFIQSESWAIVEGKGEKIKKLFPDFSFYGLIIVPSTGISTSQAYSLWNPSLTGSRWRDKIKFCESQQINLNFLKDISYNIFEYVVKNSICEEYRQMLFENGAEVARMTGSGSAIYGIFSDKQKAEKAGEKLRRKGYRVFLVEPV